MPTCVCHWTPTTAFVRHRHVPNAANQHASWRSLIRCCWTSRIEQSANPAARVGHYTRTISTSTQTTSIWSLTAAAPSDSVLRALCTNLLTYLLRTGTIKGGNYDALLLEATRRRASRSGFNHDAHDAQTCQIFFLAKSDNPWLRNHSSRFTQFQYTALPRVPLSRPLAEIA